MKRKRIDVEMIADFCVLARAACTAAKGKRNRPDVVRFFSNFDANIAALRHDLIAKIAPYNRFRCFTIYDPKQRVITAVSFEDRIIHHALMIFASPILERALIPQTFACREKKGPLAAVVMAQQYIRKYPWYVKIDIAKYFETIDHDILLSLLFRKFKGSFCHDLLQRIVSGYQTAKGKGLPIGSLTSQHFANYYLSGVDRLLTEHTLARAYVRYMDDMVWWCDSKQIAKQILADVTMYVNQARQLRIKDNTAIQKSAQGLPFCGFRLFPGTIKLTTRKKRRYSKGKAYWEQQYTAGHIDANLLQKAYDSVKGITVHACANGWMRNQLAHRPGLEV